MQAHGSAASCQSQLLLHVLCYCSTAGRWSPTLTLSLNLKLCGVWAGGDKDQGQSSNQVGQGQCLCTNHAAAQALPASSPFSAERYA